MNLPDRTGKHLPRIISNPPLNKRMLREEQVTQLDIWRTGLANFKDEVEADMEEETNAAIVKGAFDHEVHFHDEGVAKVGTSKIKQRILLNREAVLAALNDNTIIRHRR